jgi:hypothetical protein
VANTSTYIWDPSSADEGSHTISAHATNELGQRGSDTVIITLTSEEVTTTTTTTTLIPGETTSITTSTTTTSTTTSTTPPPTLPPIKKVELAINSLTLSTASNTIKRGTDVTAYILASNAGDADEVSEREFFIRGARLETGSHTLKAKILVQGGGVEETDLSNNERSIGIIVEEETRIFDSIKPILKWLAVGIVILVLARIIITFIFQREEDYLR